MEAKKKFMAVPLSRGRESKGPVIMEKITFLPKKNVPSVKLDGGGGKALVAN